MRRLVWGNELMISTAFSLSWAFLIQSLYKDVGINGSERSLNQYFKSEAGTFGSSIPVES